MERPRPTSQLILELTGSNQGLLSATHHGLREVSLRDFYPYLNLDEVVAFAAGSWQLRDRDLGSFTALVDSASGFELLEYSSGLYEIFSQVFSTGFPWLNKNKNISPELKQVYERFEQNLKR